MQTGIASRPPRLLQSNSQVNLELAAIQVSPLMPAGNRAIARIIAGRDKTPSMNSQRLDLAVIEHERVVKLGGAAGEITGQARMQLDVPLGHCGVNRFQGILVLGGCLLFPRAYGVAALILAAFVVHLCIVRETLAELVQVLRFVGGQVGSHRRR